jgi:protein involved in polysaccharide export with SLBB domain
VGNIVVLGAVTAQNNFPRTSPVSIFQILASAGGPTTEADLGHVRVFRNGDLSREEELDLSGIMTPGNRMGRSAPMVYPGDLVFVPKSDNFLKEFAPFAYNIVVVLTLFSFVK